MASRTNFYLILLIFCAAILPSSDATAQGTSRYKDPSLSPQKRTEDLLGRMTLEEKVGQMLCPLGWEMYDNTGKVVTHSEKFEKYVSERHIGMLWAVYRADPWTQKTLDNGLDPYSAAMAGNALQKYIIENTRLGIPIFLAEEAPHGHMAIGTTVFPTGIGLAATWSDGLVEQIGKAIAKEIRLQGAHISYGPVLDLAREPRWSRVEETYGEDPILTGRLGAAMVRGTGGGNISDPYATIATLKHFAAYAVPESGHNGNMAVTTPRDMLENILPPFKMAIDAGTLSVMSSYNSIDGVPTTADRELFTGILREQWGFRGFAVSDLGSIEGIRGSHRVARTVEDAAIMAAEAGIDSDLGGDAHLRLVDAVKAGKVSESVIDTAVSRILRLKFEMGLFENPYVDPDRARREVRNSENIELARKAARMSVVLLENRNSTLPLNKNMKVAVIGPNADNVYNILGDYTAPQQEGNVKTVLDGIKAKVGARRVEYVKGCAIRDTVNVDIEAAAAAARRADVAVVVVGGSSARDFKTKYIETGAAVATKESISDMESGEGFDRATLGLLGKQMELLKAVKATGTPTVVVYIQGRPLEMNWASENADALLTAWYPGQEGGNGIADVLFGDYNPAGRLPVTVPRHVGQLPVHYNRRIPLGHNYVEMSASPLYSFGYGISYTQFEYSGLEVEQKGRYDFDVTVNVANTGERDGEEVVQLYLRDEFASVSRPMMQLKHFDRIMLRKGESRKVTFRITEDDLGMINARMERVVEPGSFQVTVGGGVGNQMLRSTFEVE